MVLKNPNLEHFCPTVLNAACPTQPDLWEGNSLWHTVLFWCCALVWVQAQFFWYHGPGSLWTLAGSFLRERLTLSEEEALGIRPKTPEQQQVPEECWLWMGCGTSRTRAEPQPAEPPTATAPVGQSRSFPLQSVAPWQFGLQCFTTARGAPVCSLYPRKSRINSIYDSSFVFTVRCYFYYTFLEVIGGW